MEPYKNIGRDSGVTAFEIGDDYIRVQFKDSAIYLYTYASAGAAHIEQMKKLACAGNGLNTYINTRVRKAYEVREA